MAHVTETFFFVFILLKLIGLYHTLLLRLGLFL